MDKVFTEFDKWVSSRGNGQYATNEDVLTPIQQIKDEIVELVEVIRKLNLSTSALEIGLGVYGGTHMLWRLLFDTVITIDNDQSVMDEFIKREHLDERSWLIAGDSKEVFHQLPSGHCFLHIDGDHTYDGVKADYLNYANLVRPGGLIAIHDALFPSVSRFLDDLENGRIDGRKHSIERIIKSTRVGYGIEVINNNYENI